MSLKFEYCLIKLNNYKRIQILLKYDLFIQKKQKPKHKRLENIGI